MKKSLIAIASILAIVAGCAKNDPQAKVSDGTIKASIENTQSRATLSYGGEADNFLVWEEADSFRLFDGTSGIKCTLVSGVGAKIGSFTPEPVPEPVDTYYAVYPYNNSSVGTDGVFSVVIPDEVEYDPETGFAEKGEDGSANVMVAKSSSTEIAFKNVCSYVCLTVTGTSDQKVSSINILPKDGETTVAGTAQITIDGGEPVLAFDGTVTSNTESVVFAEPVSLENGLDLKVAVAPVYTDGIQVIVTLENGEYQILTSNTTIGRNEIVKMPEFTFAAVEVAEVGGENYTTLAAAVAAANASESDVTINMLADAASSSAVGINNTNGKKITLNLNGKIVSSQIIVTTDFEVADATGNGVVEAEEKTIKMGEDGTFGVNATFTLNGGTVRTLDGNYAISADGVKNGDQPTVLVKKGNVIGTGGNAVRIKYATATFGDDTEGDIVVAAQGYQYAIWTSTSANVTINKGTYTLDEGTKALYYFGDGSSKVTIKDGIFESNVGMFGFYKTTTNPTVTIENGKFTWADSALFQDTNTKSSVSGGYFTAAVPNANVAAGYICVESTEVPGYSYKVVENQDKSVMEVGGAKYDSVAEAVAAANAASTATLIKVLQDVDITSAIQFTTSAPLTLDLNGHKITAANTTTATSAIEMNTEGVNLTIVDNSEGATGVIDEIYGNTAYTIVVNTGTLTINSGTICNSSSTGTGRWALKIVGEEGKAAPTVNINGGYIYGGRAVNIGSGIAGIVPVVNITGGTIETKNTSTTGDYYQYGALCFLNDYYTCKMTGGTLVAKTTSCFYTNRKETGSTFIIGDPEDPTKVPYFWVESADGFSFRSGSGDASARVFVYNAYINNKTSKNSVFVKATGATVHNLDPVVTDGAGREYGYKVYVDASSDN